MTRPAAHVPDPDAPWWNLEDVAAYIGVKVRTAGAYRKWGFLPDPVGGPGSRAPQWKPARIIDWHKSRPSVTGKRASRPVIPQ